MSRAAEFTSRSTLAVVRLRTIEDEALHALAEDNSVRLAELSQAATIVQEEAESIRREAEAWHRRRRWWRFGR